MGEIEAKRRCVRAFGGWRQSYLVERAFSVAESNDMRPVLANDEGEVLMLDPYSGQHFLFSPTGPCDEYDGRDHVTDISVGEPIPGRFLADSWTVLDPDWRWRVESDRVDELTERDE